MNLENQFTVPLPVEEAWPVLLDVQRVAPCMPGATLLSVEGDDFTGTVKVKIGPVQMTYKGNAKFAKKDSAAHRAVIEASGKDTKGGGTAAATVTLTAHGNGSSTRVQVLTDLNITGRPAQFGRGVMSEVAGKLITQFAGCLSQELTSSGSAADAPGTPTTEAEPEAAQPVLAPGAPSGAAAALPAHQPQQSAEAIDLLSVAGDSVAKRAVPVLSALVVILFVLWRRAAGRG